MFFFFFFNDTATTEIYTLSLHDALPISRQGGAAGDGYPICTGALRGDEAVDRKSTRLNSSHGYISYAVFCLKKKHGAPRTARSPRRTSSRRTSRSVAPCTGGRGERPALW